MRCPAAAVALRAAPLLLALVLAGWASPSARAALEDGVIVDQERAEAVEAFLPPEIYQHYARGEYWNRYFDLARPGLLSFSPPPLMSYQVSDQPWHTPDDGRTWISSGSATYQNAENLKLGRSTGIRFARGETFPADYGIALQAADFSPETLVRAGK